MIDCSDIIKDQGVPDDLVRTVVMAANCAFEIGGLREFELKRLTISIHSSSLFEDECGAVAKDNGSYTLFDFVEEEAKKLAGYNGLNQKIRLAIPALKKSKRLRRLTFKQALSFAIGHEIGHHLQNVRGDIEFQKAYSIYTDIREEANMDVLEREANRMGSLVIRRLYGVDFNLHYT